MFMNLPIYKLTLIFVFANVFHSFAQKTTDTIKPMPEILIEGEYKDLERLPQLDGTRINSGKKNEVINLLQSNADLSTNNSRQIFSKVPGLSIWENDGSGIQTGIATRGLSPNRSWEFNVRQNGYDISSEVFGYPEAYYTPPSEALERIEIIRGAGALQYGPQFGGLLNYITKKSLGNKPVSVEMAQTIGSYGMLNSFNAIGGKVKKISYYAYIHHRGADGWRENSLYQTQTGSISLSYDITPKLQINAEYSRMNYISQQAGGLTYKQFSDNWQQSSRKRNWFSTPWNSGAISLNYNFNSDTRLTMKFFGTLAERNSVGFVRPISVEDTINTLIGSYNPRQVDTDIYRNLGAEIRGIHQYHLLGKKSAFSSGLRLYYGNTTRNQLGIGTTEMDYDLHISVQQNGLDFGRSLTFQTQNLAAFVENMFKITDRLAITPGVRYELVRSFVEGYINTSSTGQINEQQRDRNIILFGLGIEYNTTKTSNIYANFSQGFRPVLFSELTPSATTDIIDQNLKDATGYNLDFGYRGSLFKNILKFDIGAFNLFYDNRIGTITVNNAPFRTNIGASRSQGIESYVELDIVKLIYKTSTISLRLFSNYAFVDARYTRWDNPAIQNDPSTSIKDKKVENAPNHILRTGFNIGYKGLKATVQYNYVSDVFTDAINSVQPNSSFTTGKLPSYNLIDINLAYQFKENYLLRAGVNNLTDEVYATRRAGGYPGPGILPGTGRTFYLGVGLKF
jgi:Fe(3+) dicitrate transport protein